MKNKKTTVISTIAATAIIVSIFAFNSNAFELKGRTIGVNNPVEASTSNTVSTETGNKQTSVSAALAASPESAKQTNKADDKQSTSQNTSQGAKKVSNDSTQIEKVLQTVSQKTAEPEASNVSTSVIKNSENCSNTAAPTASKASTSVSKNCSNANLAGISNNQQANINSLLEKLKDINKSYSCNLPTKITDKLTSNSGSTSKPVTSNSTTAKPSTDTEKPASNTTSTPSTSTASGDYSAFQKKVVELVNAERAKAGLNALKMNTELSKVATLKSQDMAKNNYFDHNSPTYGSPFDMMKKFGISYRTAGENIAMGQTTPEQVMNGWMNSSGHRANILKASFTEIGVGIAKNSSGRLYWTQQFIG